LPALKFEDKKIFFFLIKKLMRAELVLPGPSSYRLAKPVEIFLKSGLLSSKQRICFLISRIELAAP